MADLYKAYIPTKDKKALVPFKNKSAEELYTYQQVANMPGYAGVLADDTILIDVDDQTHADKMLNIVRNKGLKCKVYATTRGYHFLFKTNDTLTPTNKTGCKLACGIVADIKLGKRCSYEVLKRFGEVRPIIYDSGDYQILPKYLTPINTNIDLVNLTNGSRNSTLFGYILPLQKSGFSVEEARECIRIANEFVLNEPLSEEELATVLRDEAFNKPQFFNSSGTFLFDKFAIYLKNNSNIIKLNNQLYLYKDGIYKNGEYDIEAEMITQIPNLNKAKRAEVMAYLNILVRDNMQRADANYIAFKNGIYSLCDECLQEFSPEYIITNKINTNYNENVYSKIVDDTLNKMSCYDKYIRMLLEEVIGYCMFTRNELGKAFILLGNKSNGKSSFLDMIKTLLGDDNVASLDLKELDARFKTSQLVGKLVNLGDDIGDEFIANAAIFKKLVTGDRVNVEEKGLRAFDFDNYSKLLFSANNMPRIKDKTGAVLRRLVIIPFDMTFSPNDPDFDPYIKYKLRSNEAMEYLAQIGLQGLKRVLANRGFTEPNRVKKELAEYELFNNPIVGFFEEFGADEIANQPTKYVYNEYQKYCTINQMQPMSNVEFSKQVKRKFNYDVVVRKINEKSVRIFVKK